MNEKRFHQLSATFVLIFSFIVYFMTMAPTVSFWDSGEFIAASFKLAIPHPPGAPLYLLVGRIFSILPIFEDIARRVNFISTISSALTVFFLYLISVHVIKNYLKPREGFGRYIPYLASTIGSLTFAFTNSFWFNAVEAEVYASSMLFTSLVIWLIFRWSERSDEIGNEKYILFIFYLVGLAIGVHLLNVLTLPTVFLIIFYKKYKVNLTNLVYLALVGILLTGLVYPGVVKGVPLIADIAGFMGLAIALITLILVWAWAVRNKRHVWALMSMMLLLLTIGYSTYLMIYIRSNLDPNIDENDPETIEKLLSYLNREQYGKQSFDRYQAWQQSPNKQKYSSAWDFFWDYQINYMYVRYLLWNFVGKHINQRDVDFARLWGIPFLLGLLGAYYHFRRDWKYALAIFVLFFMTGLAIVLYLNQPDPQPRERDYSYVGSFFAFSIWISVGVAVILEWLSKNLFRSRSAFATSFAALVLFLISPVNALVKNYDMQDRTGNYVAWDYSYNMLVSTEPNGILFTNGDNDTFPLWYLQEVEGIRPDVRVANLSLLNTNWYIKQLKEKEPKVPISLSDKDIERIMPIPWPKKRKIEIDIPKTLKFDEWKEYKDYFRLGIDKLPDKMVFDLGPKIFGRYLRVQDYMILNILVSNRFRKPLYFAVTVSQDNLLDGLQNYLRMDGLVYKIIPVPNWRMDPEKIYDNLMNKFKFRNLNDPDVFFNPNIVALLQNYRAAFIELARYFFTTNDTTRFKAVVRKAYDVMPPEVIPYTNTNVKQYMETFAYVAGVKKLDQLNRDDYSDTELQRMGELGMILQDWEFSKKAFELVQEAHPDQIRVKGFLIDVYEKLGEYDKAINILEEWLKLNPNDKSARQRLEKYKKLQEEAKK